MNPFVYLYLGKPKENQLYLSEIFENAFNLFLPCEKYLIDKFWVFSQFDAFCYLYTAICEVIGSDVAKDKGFVNSICIYVFSSLTIWEL